MNNEEIKKGDRVILYFHGNAEDVTDNIQFLDHIQKIYNCSVIAMEYPGYGFFKNQIINGQANQKKKFGPSPKMIKKCAKTLF